jgi:hypothetical protein
MVRKLSPARAQKPLGKAEELNLVGTLKLKVHE